MQIEAYFTIQLAPWEEAPTFRRTKKQKRVGRNCFYNKLRKKIKSSRTWQWNSQGFIREWYWSRRDRLQHLLRLGSIGTFATFQLTLSRKYQSLHYRKWWSDSIKDAQCLLEMSLHAVPVHYQLRNGELHDGSDSLPIHEQIIFQALLRPRRKLCV